MDPRADDEWREQAERDLAGLVAALEEIHQAAILGTNTSMQIPLLARQALEKHGGLVYG